MFRAIANLPYSPPVKTDTMIIIRLFFGYYSDFYIFFIRLAMLMMQKFFFVEEKCLPYNAERQAR